jgi:hypothetical protein
MASTAIRSRLDAIAADAEAAGFRFRDTASARERHLDWVFDLAMRRITVPQLAEERGESEEAVARAVSRMATKLRIRTDGWFATNRTTNTRR